MLELVVGISIISITLFSITASVQLAMKAAQQNTRSIKANFLAEEGIEAVKTMRDNGWTANIATLATGTDYYLLYNGVRWATTTTNIFVDKTFERRFRITAVYRDANGNIASSGSADNGTKKITIYVAWPARGGRTTAQMSAYITNLFKN